MKVEKGETQRGEYWPPSQFPKDDPHGQDGSPDYHGQVCVACTVAHCAECDGDPALCNRCGDGFSQAGQAANTKCVGPEKSVGFKLLIAFGVIAVLCGIGFRVRFKRAKAEEARQLEVARLGGGRGGGEGYKSLVEA